MIKNKKFGLIDSQDALRGNLLYDVASLIDDVRSFWGNGKKICAY